MAKFCTKCGAPLTEGRKFCVKCGTKLVEAAAVEEAAQKSADNISEKKVPQPEMQQSASAQNTTKDMAAATQNKQHTSVPENNLANKAVNTPTKNKAGSSKFAIIALCLVILAVIGGVGGFFGFKAYKENNYVQAAAKVQSVLTANQATLQKLESIKAEGYPDNAKALAEEISQSIENLDKASGEFGVAEEPDKYKGMTDNISSVMASEKKLLESVRFLLEKPGDKESAGNLTAAKAAIGEIKEAAGKISIEGIDFASCTDLSAFEGQLSVYTATAAELERKKAEAEAKSLGKKGVITADDVIFRTEPSTAGRQIGVLGKNTQVTVLEEWRCDDRSAGMIAAEEIIVYAGGRDVTLKHGQAINIIDNSGGNWLCTFKLGNEILETYISPQFIKRLYDEVWYHVRLADGKEGYVFSHYVALRVD